MNRNLAQVTRIGADHLGVAGLRALGSALGFAATLGVTALLGAQGSGILFGTIAWALGLAIIARWGGQDVLLLELPRASDTAGSDSLIGRVLRTAFVRSLVLVALVAISGIALDQTGHTAPLDWLMLIALLPVTVVLQLLAAALKGMSRPRIALFAELVIPPAIVLLAIALAHGRIGSPSFNYFAASYVIASFVGAAMLAIFALRRTLWRSANKLHRSDWSERANKFAVAELSLFLSGFLALLMLPFLLGEEATGVFNLVLRMVGIAGLIPATVYVLIAPKLVTARESGDDNGWRSAIAEGRTIMMISAIAYGVVLWLAGPTILQWTGEEFGAATGSLKAMTMLYAAGIALGPNGAILAAMEREDLSRKIAVYSAIVALLVLVPATLTYGLIGAACATGAVFFGQRLALAIAHRQAAKFSPAG